MIEEREPVILEREGGEGLEPDAGYGADYRVTGNHHRIWITVKGLAVQINAEHDGLIIDVFDYVDDKLQQMSDGIVGTMCIDYPEYDDNGINLTTPEECR